MERVGSNGIVRSIRPFVAVLVSGLTVGEQFIIRVDGRVKTQTMRLFYDESVTGGSFSVVDREGLKILDHTLSHEDISFCTWVLAQEITTQTGRITARSLEVRIMRHPAVNITPLDFGQMPRMLASREFDIAKRSFTPKSAIYDQLAGRFATQDEYDELMELVEALPEPDDLLDRFTTAELKSLQHDFSPSNISSALVRSSATMERLSRENFVHPADVHLFEGEAASAGRVLAVLGLSLY